MVNKRKKIAREISAKTGMAYQAALNQRVASKKLLPDRVVALLKASLGSDSAVEFVRKGLRELKGTSQGVSAEGVLLYWAICEKRPDIVGLVSDAPELNDNTLRAVVFLRTGKVTQARAQDQMQYVEMAACHGDLDSVKLLEHRKGIDWQQVTLEAAHYHQPEVLKHTLSRVDVNWGSGALIRNAARYPELVSDAEAKRQRKGSLACIKILLTAGADPNLPNPEEEYGHALTCACSCLAIDNVEALLDGGADPDVANGAPLSKSLTRHAKKIRSLLIARGASKVQTKKMFDLMQIYGHHDTVFELRDHNIFTPDQIQEVLEFALNPDFPQPETYWGKVEPPWYPDKEKEKRAAAVRAIEEGWERKDGDQKPQVDVLKLLADQAFTESGNDKNTLTYKARVACLEALLPYQKIDLKPIHKVFSDLLILRVIIEGRRFDYLKAKLDSELPPLPEGVRERFTPHLYEEARKRADKRAIVLLAAGIKLPVSL